MTADKVEHLRTRRHPLLPELRPEEQRLHAALTARQAVTGPYDSFAIFIQPCTRVRQGKYFKPDFVVIMNSALVVEIDGTSHAGRYVSDRTRDELLHDCHLPVMRLPIEDLEDAMLIEDWVDRILTRIQKLRYSAA